MAWTSKDSRGTLITYSEEALNDSDKSLLLDRGITILGIRIEFSSSAVVGTRKLAIEMQDSDGDVIYSRGLKSTLDIGNRERVVIEMSPDAAFIDTDAVSAQGTLTVDAIATDTNTMTVDAKVYTFQTTLTDVDGNIFKGADKAGTQGNLVGAINLTGTAGTDYATSMTLHPTVAIAAFSGDAAVLTAESTGTAGNSIATTETFTSGGSVFDAATLGTTTKGEAGTARDFIPRAMSLHDGQTLRIYDSEAIDAAADDLIIHVRAEKG